MQDTDLLTAMAQLAVGLAGFTGVASVFGPRGDQAQVRAQAERLRGMLEIALTVASAALLPVVLERTGVAAPMTWRIAAGCLFAVAVPNSILGIRRAIAVNRAAGVTAAANVLWRAFVTAFAAFVAVALVVGLAGLVPIASAYVAALYALLIWSGILFLRFFLAGS